MKELLMCCPKVLRLAASKSSHSGRGGRRSRGARMPRETARRKASDRRGRSGCSRAQASSPATKSGGSRKAKVRSRPVAGRPRLRLFPVLLLFMPDCILGNTDNTRPGDNCGPGVAHDLSPHQFAHGKIVGWAKARNAPCPPWGKVGTAPPSNVLVCRLNCRAGPLPTLRGPNADHRTNSRMARSRPSSVSGYMRSPNSWRTMRIE
jgi:hypothetical protein